MLKFKDLNPQEKVDESTGFHLYSRLNKSQRKYAKQIAKHVIELYRQGGAK